MNGMRVLATAALAAALTGCSTHETGPSLSFVVEGESLAPTTAEPGASAVCCCRVRGSVMNTSSIPVHVNLNFEGRDASGASLGTGLDFVANIPAGGRASFDAAGIVAACARVASLDRRHSVTGVYVGPRP